MATVDADAAGRFLSSEPVARMLTERAEKLAEVVKANVPVQSGHSRLYIDSIAVAAPEGTKDGATVSVTTDDPFWHLIEYGSINNEPLAPMRRALVNLGFKFEETSKP